MKYTNIILTIIALTLIYLSLLLHKSMTITAKASSFQDVNISAIGGVRLYGNVLKVREVK